MCPNLSLAQYLHIDTICYFTTHSISQNETKVEKMGEFLRIFHSNHLYKVTQSILKCCFEIEIKIVHIIQIDHVQLQIWWKKLCKCGGTWAIVEGDECNIILQFRKVKWLGNWTNKLNLCSFFFWKKKNGNNIIQNIHLTTP